MLISCPKCNAVYSVSDENIPTKGKKFKCAECENIWTVYPEDIQESVQEESSPQKTPATPETPKTDYFRQDIDDDYMQEMFQRLSADTKGLFTTNQETSQTKFRQVRRKIELLFSPLLISLLILLLLFAILLGLAYTNRYDVVRLVPRLENFYRTLGIESIYQGRDLQFKNIEIFHMEENGRHYIEVKGQIMNTGNYKIRVLPIQATLKDENNNVTDKIIKILPMKYLKPNFMTLFKITLKNKVATPQTFDLSFDPDYEKQLQLERKRKKQAEEKEKKKKAKQFNFGTDNYKNF